MTISGFDGAVADASGVPSTDERRRKRSDDPLIALHYQLAHTRRESCLEAIVVADGSGVVVAAAGAWAMCEELAAYAPLLAQGQWTEPGLDDTSRVAALRTEVDVQPVDVDGQIVLLCSRGGRRGAAALDRAAEGVARILHVAA
jgi:hypothetical protein